MKVLKNIGFWLLSLTWGLPMTLIGVLVAIALLITGHKPRRFHQYIYFEVGHSWGGCELGPFFICNEYPRLALKQHECGHGIQNIILGPFMPLVISIPSAIRYWYRIYLVNSGKKKESELPDYDSIWFEGWATKLGKRYE